MDDFDLLPGDRWKTSLRRTIIYQARAFISLLSRKAVSKRGTFYLELRLALEIVSECPEDTIFLLPVRIDDCVLPVSITEILNYIDIFPNYDLGLQRILAALTCDQSRSSISPALRKGAAQSSLDHTGLEHAVRLFRARAFRDAARLLTTLEQQHPTNPDVRFYLALCLLGNKRPKLLSMRSVASVEQHIITGLTLNPSSDHLRLLLALVRSDYYELNGLRSPAPDSSTILAANPRTEPEKVADILLSVSAPGNALWNRLRSDSTTFQHNQPVSREETSNVQEASDGRD
jgi:TIR domain